ncbi:MAG: PqqD family protein [Ruminococcaceae bacterium]|nr:PqqD family protein [Oscillospiraceae bacterium]
MKINSGFVVRKIGDSFYAMPLTNVPSIGCGMIKLNETAHLMWKKIEEGFEAEAVADAVCEEYDVSKETALRDVTAFVKKLEEAGILE